MTSNVNLFKIKKCVKGLYELQNMSSLQSRNRAQNVLPCTTAEILSATQNDDKFYSGEIELSQVERLLIKLIYPNTL